MGCPDEQDFLDLVAGRWKGDGAAEIERHLDQCARCSALVAGFAALSVTEGEGGGAPLAPGDRVGRYVVLDRLAAGGMGQVHIARDPDLDRKVALKLVRDRNGEPGGSAAQARLLREAQAMARLAHPNVVAIHDVGTLGDRVFMAMELVEGVTLGEWLTAAPREAAAILAVFVQAGRGLAAAHAAGIVHRDFKPANVLVGDDGRVRVTDFGLARARRDPDVIADLARAPTALVGLGTETGAVVGTPLYMAPEQHRGDAIDARTDQFAFCVALYEALHRQRPFRGATADELAAEVLAGRLVPPPASSRVPDRASRAVARGLAVDPADRHATMDALLDKLAAAPRRGRWIAAAAVAAAGVIAAALALVLGRAATPAPSCDGGAAFAAAAWDAPRRVAMRTAFAASGSPRASTVFAEATALLDRRAGDIARAHDASCRATHLTGEQSDAVLDLRASCLDRQREELAALTGLFGRADVAVVGRALDAIYDLPPASECDAARVLAARDAAPPAAAAAKVAQLRRDLAAAGALGLAGKYRESVAAARRIADAARAVGYGPIEASALLRLGKSEITMHDARAAEDGLTSALHAATRAGAETTAADAALSLGYLTGIEMGRQDEGERWLGQGKALVERSGARGRLAADALQLEGLFAREAGRYKEALTAFRAAQDAYRAAHGPGHPNVGLMLSAAGTMMAELGDLAGAQAAHEQALAILEKAYGKDDPDLVVPLVNLGQVVARRGDTRKAIALHERAISLEEAASGADSFGLATPLMNAGGVLGDAGDMAGARRYFERALRIAEKAHGRDHPVALRAIGNLALTYAADGDTGRAAALLEERLARTERTLGRDNPALIDILVNLAGQRQRQRRHSDARALYTRALSVAEHATGPDDPRLIELLNGVAATWRAARRPARAIAPLERALAIAERARLPGPDRAAAQLALAGALRAARRDPARARSLAGQAAALRAKKDQ
ncbi:MAG TPA: serine/threonine-protein kinase [Kofleriaceae bacterium]|nr:serine/threonine-protein kinase [Kofleriaceae bacterium]